MDKINIIILNQWNLDLNSTMEEYGTADDSTSGDLASDFNWDLKRRGLAIAMTIWLIFAKMFWFWFWSTAAKILLKLVGYAGIGLTFGRGYEFVNLIAIFIRRQIVHLTFFQWTDEMGTDLEILAYGTAALTLMNIKELIQELMIELQELIIEYREAIN
jgi:hypothetical protein